MMCARRHAIVVTARAPARGRRSRSSSHPRRGARSCPARAGGRSRRRARLPEVLLVGEPLEPSPQLVLPVPVGLVDEEGRSSRWGPVCGMARWPRATHIGQELSPASAMLEPCPRRRRAARPRARCACSACSSRARRGPAPSSPIGSASPPARCAATSTGCGRSATRCGPARASGGGYQLGVGGGPAAAAARRRGGRGGGGVAAAGRRRHGGRPRRAGDAHPRQARPGAARPAARQRRGGLARPR